MDFSSACTPAKVHVILAVFTLFGSFFAMPINIPLIQIVTSTFFSVVWSIVWFWLLNWLCSIGFETLSWVLVLLPFIIFFGAFIVMFAIIGIMQTDQANQKKTENK